ncbi:Hypothetical predicted protein [Olea europaea subsp. europaea]|uniref:Uncharacterized protein n=1 Tax=Olea europaea subsp. europaea TaxID=158383 RepID=A0A8S0SVQ8_OLEEU|nr:Hypothetical predicted protein [Olea europaea subsp. europaea]
MRFAWRNSKRTAILNLLASIQYISPSSKNQQPSSGDLSEKTDRSIWTAPANNGLKLKADVGLGQKVFTHHKDSNSEFTGEDSTVFGIAWD